MQSLQDDYDAYTAAQAAVAPLQAAAAAADAALAAGQALVVTTGAQLAADVAEDGPGFVGPDPTTGTITAIEPSSTVPGFNLEVLPPASSLPGGVGQTPPPAPPAPTS
jgi:hypothetical protein